MGQPISSPSASLAGYVGKDEFLTEMTRAHSATGYKIRVAGSSDSERRIPSLDRYPPAASDESKSEPFTGTGAQQYLKDALENLAEFQRTGETASIIKGLELIDKALDADKGYVALYYWKAYMHTKIGEHEAAISALDDGIKQDHKNGVTGLAYLYFFRGMVKHKEGKLVSARDDYLQAIEAYRKDLRTNPRDWNAVLNIIQALILMERKQEARDFLKEITEKNPEERWLREVARDIEELESDEILGRM
jgi:tetratricopeptide (TPR) repeat protein